MSSFAADIGNGGNHVFGKLALHTQAPLLGVSPDRLGGDRGNVNRISHAATDVGITLNGIRLGHGQHQWRAAFQRSCIGFLRRAVLVEQAVSAANRGFAVALGVPGKTDAWGGVENMAAHATVGNAVLTALHHPTGHHRIWRQGKSYGLACDQQVPAAKPLSINRCRW